MRHRVPKPLRLCLDLICGFTFLASAIAVWRLPFMFQPLRRISTEKVWKYCCISFAVSVVDILLLPFAVVLLCSWRCCSLVDRWQSSPAHPDWNFSWNARTSVVTEFGIFLLDLVFYLPPLCILLVTWRAPYVVKGWYYFPTEGTRFNIERRKHIWREFGMLLVDIATLPSLAIALFSWRAPFLIQQWKTQPTSPDAYNLVRRQEAFIQAGLFFLDLSCVLPGLLTLISWRSYYLVKKWKESNGLGGGANLNRRCFIWLAFSKTLSDIPFFLLVAFIHICFWRAPSFWIRICNLWGQMPHRRWALNYRPVVLDLAVACLMDIATIPFGLLVFVTGYRTEPWILECELIDTRGGTMSEKQWLLISHGVGVIVDAPFGLAGLVVLITIWRSRILIHYFRAASISGQRRLLCIQHLALLVRDVAFFILFILMIPITHRFVSLICTLWRRTRHDHVTEPQLHLQEAKPTLTDTQISIHIEGVKQPDFTITKLRLHVVNKEVWSQCEAFLHKPLLGELQNMLPLDLLPSHLPTEAFAIGTQEVVADIVFPCSLGRDALIQILNQAPRLSVFLKIEFDNGEGTLFCLNFTLQEVLNAERSNTSLPLGLQHLNRPQPSTFLASIFWEEVSIHWFLAIRDIVAFLLFVLLHLHPYYGVRLWERLMDTPAQKTFHKVKEIVQNTIHSISERKEWLARATFYVEEQVKAGQHGVVLFEPLLSHICELQKTIKFLNDNKQTLMASIVQECLDIEDAFIQLHLEHINQYLRLPRDQGGEPRSPTTQNLCQQVVANGFPLKRSWTAAIPQINNHMASDGRTAGAEPNGEAEQEDGTSDEGTSATTPILPLDSLTGYGTSGPAIARVTPKHPDLLPWAEGVDAMMKDKVIILQDLLQQHPLASQGYGEDHVDSETDAESPSRSLLHSESFELQRSPCQKGQFIPVIFDVAGECILSILALISAALAMATIYRAPSTIWNIAKSRNKVKTSFLQLKEVFLDFFHGFLFVLAIFTVRDAYRLPRDCLVELFYDPSVEKMRRIIWTYSRNGLYTIWRIGCIIASPNTYKYILLSITTGLMSPAVLTLQLDAEGLKAALKGSLVMFCVVVCPLVVAILTVQKSYFHTCIDIANALLVILAVVACVHGIQGDFTRLITVHSKHIEMGWLNCSYFLCTVLECIQLLSVLSFYCMDSVSIVPWMQTFREWSLYTIGLAGQSWAPCGYPIGFWIALALALIYYILVGLRITVEHWLGLAPLGTFSCSLQARMATDLCGRISFVFVVFNLQSLLNCNYVDGQHQLVVNPDIKCWDDGHEWFAVLAVLTLLFYSVMAILDQRKFLPHTLMVMEIVWLPQIETLSLANSVLMICLMAKLRAYPMWSALFFLALMSLNVIVLIGYRYIAKITLCTSEIVYTCKLMACVLAILMGLGISDTSFDIYTTQLLPIVIGTIVAGTAVASVMIYLRPSHLDKEVQEVQTMLLNLHESAKKLGAFGPYWTENVERSWKHELETSQVPYLAAAFLRMEMNMVLTVYSIPLLENRHCWRQKMRRLVMNHWRFHAWKVNPGHWNPSLTGHSSFLERIFGTGSDFALNSNAQWPYTSPGLPCAQQLNLLHETIESFKSCWCLPASPRESVALRPLSV